MQFLSKRRYKPVMTPFFMNKSMMGKVAALAEFDEALYKVLSPLPPSPFFTFCLFSFLSSPLLSPSSSHSPLLSLFFLSPPSPLRLLPHLL
jgi:seryl-tRNA synthetase